MADPADSSVSETSSMPRVDSVASSTGSVGSAPASYWDNIPDICMLEGDVMMQMTNVAMHKDMEKDMREFKHDKPDGTLAEWATTSEWSRDTGGERDENGAPIRALDGIWKELFTQAEEQMARSMAILKKLDLDVDGYLNYRELLTLARLTGGNVTEEDYRETVCKDIECDPEQGLDTLGLCRLYEELNLGNLGRDYETVLKLNMEGLDVDLLLAEAPPKASTSTGRTTSIFGKKKLVSEISDAGSDSSWMDSPRNPNSTSSPRTSAKKPPPGSPAGAKKKRGGLSNFFLSAEPDEDEPSDLPEEVVHEAQRLLAVSRTPVSVNNDDHAAQLTALWTCAGLGPVPNPLVPPPALEAEGIKASCSWRSIGFQNEDPTTDFRATGMLGLEALSYMANEHTDYFRMELLMGQSKPGQKRGLPFAIASINMTSMLLNMMELNEEALAEEQGGTMLLRTLGSGAGGSTGTTGAFNVANSAAVTYLRRLWQAERDPGWEDFDRLVEQTKFALGELIMNRAGMTAGITVEELKKWASGPLNTKTPRSRQKTSFFARVDSA